MVQTRATFPEVSNRDTLPMHRQSSRHAKGGLYSSRRHGGNPHTKVQTVMREFKHGTLRSGKPGPGKGPLVSSRRQAVAIALHEAGLSRRSG